MRPPDQAPVERRRPSRFQDLYRPVRVLVFLLIILVLLQIYADASVLVNKVLGVLLLFVFATIVALLLNPLVDRVETIGFLKGRRGLAVLALNAGIILVFAGFMAVLIPSVASQGAAFVATLPKLSSDIQTFANGVIADLNARGIPIQASVPNNLGSVIAPVLGSAVQIITGTVGAAVNLILIVVIAIYLQIGGRNILRSLRNLFPRQQELFDFTVVAAGSTTVAYVRAQVIFATIMAVYTAITLSLIGVHFALVVAVITFFLELVPLLGAPVAMVFMVLVALLQGPLVVGLTATATVLGHLVVAYTIGLRLYGRSAKIHPLVAMAALVLGAQLGGILGAVFAIPVAGLINVYLGALYRARGGESAFGLAQPATSGEDRADSLPSLGTEMTDEAPVQPRARSQPARSKANPKRA